MPLRLGSRIFAPRVFPTLVTIVLTFVLASLGRWQLERAEQKRVLFASFDQGSDVTRTIDASTLELPRYQHVQASGTYDSSRQILIDNMTDVEGHAGYFVLTPFDLSTGGWLLINRGWVPVGDHRSVLPAVGVPAGQRTIRGRADHLPVAGIQLGQRATLEPPFPVVANFPTTRELARLLHERPSRATDVVLLDPDQPDGYVRQWQAPGFPPLRHVAYAVQWFGLAVALVVIYVATNLHRTPDETTP